MEYLGAALEHLEQAASGAGEAVILRAQTVVEELFSNSVLHGRLADDQASSIWIGALLADGQLQVRFEDTFPAFNPFSNVPIAEAQGRLPVEQRPIGGLGVLMVYRLADVAHYRREGARNCIDLRFAADNTG